MLSYCPKWWSKKKEIAFCQLYFAIQTRKQELIKDATKEFERLVARKKLKETEKEFANTLYQREINGKGISEIRSCGDQVLFGGNTTKDMKRILGIKSRGALADHLSTVNIKAKDLASEMTIHNTKTQNLYGKEPIKEEHEGNNSEVRKMLIKRNIYPEKLPAEEDTKKLERKHNSIQKEIEERKKGKSLLNY